MSVIRLGDVLQSAFGFVTPNQSTSLEQSGFVDRNGIKGAGVYVSDARFEEITLRYGTLILKFAGMMHGDDGGKIYAPPPMISFNRSTKHIITEIDGDEAEVVERFGIRAWDIKLRGVMIDMVNHQYPKQKIKKFKEMIDVKAPFAVEGELFDDLEIKSIFFTNVDVGGIPGYEDSMQYTLDARSIKAAQFFLTPQSP